jgi:hypothetical protein
MHPVASRILARGRSALILAVLACASPAQAGGQFAAVGDMSTPRALHGAAPLPDGRVLVVGGIADFGIVLGSAELFDPASGTFALTGPLHDARSRPTTVALADGRVLVFGGRGGEGGGTYFSDAEIYDPASGQFSPGGDSGTPRYVATAALLADGRVLIAGGFNRNDGALASADLYDPATGTFTPTGSMSRPRIQTSAVVRLPDGRVLIVGGGNDDGPLASAELYDPATGTFSETGSLPEPRAGHSLALLRDGRVLVVGGSDDGASGGNLVYYPVAQLYDPASGTFTPTGSLAFARSMQTATVLPDGRVLVAGGSYVAGQPGSVTVPTAEIYDPATGTFSSVGDTVVSRDEPVAVTLPGGRVLLAGGWAFAGDTVGDLPTEHAEVFTPALQDAIFADGFEAVPLH